LAKRRQHLSLEIEANDVWVAGDDFSHRLARFLWRGDVDNAGAGVG
jgi:hypothetical protein